MLPVFNCLTGFPWSPGLHGLNTARDLKKPIKSQHTVTQAINLLDRCRLNGYAPEEIINRSIANGWQGLFEPDGQAKRSRDSGKESLHWNSPDAWEDFL